MRAPGRFGRAGVLASVIVLAGCAAGNSAAPAPEVIFTGRFITLDESRPRVEALGVTAGRIVAAGTQAEMDALAAANTRRVAVPGVAVPGWADAHVHVTSLGGLLEMLVLNGLTKEEILQKVAEAAKTTPEGQWIVGRGWDEGFFTPPAFPTAADLDAVSPRHPVVLTRIDGHSSWVSSRALALAGITTATRDPDGGRIVRDRSRRATGMLVDRAQDLVDRVRPSEDAPEDIERRIRSAMQQYSRWGLTSVHDAGSGLETIAVYKKLAAAGELPVRVYAMAGGAEARERYLAGGPEIDLHDGRLSIRSFKIPLDGALGSRGAELTEPYADAPNERGLRQMSDEELAAIVAAAREKGFQVNAHAIGDLAVRRGLDAFQQGGVTPEHRFRLEHASMIAPEDLPRFARLGVIASMQPVFVGEYGRWARDRVGPTRIEWVLPIRDLLSAGAVVASGTDFTASDSGDPIATLSALVAGKSAGGDPPPPWYSDQRVDVDAALYSMSAAPAFAAFQEKDLGQLTVGRYADFTVLSEDPYAVAPEALSTLAVRMTVVAGAVTFGRNASTDTARR